MSHVAAYEILAPAGMDYAAMGVAFVASFLLSFLWWGPIFGKKWGALMGYDMDEAPNMAMPMLLQALSTALIAYVFWHVQQAFVVTHDTDGVVMGDLTIGIAIFGAVMTWLGFFVPLQLGRVAWEKAGWGLFAINAGGHLVGLVAMAIVYALM